MRTQVINLRQKNLRHHLHLRKTLICRLLKGAGYARGSLMYRSGSCTLIRFNAVGLDTGVDGV